MLLSFNWKFLRDHNWKITDIFAEDIPSYDLRKKLIENG